MIEASWGISWAMLARRLEFSAHFRTCWRQDGGQEGEDGDQEAQDGRWEAKMGLQIHATNFDRCGEQGAGSPKRLELLVELMHWKENLIARRVPCGTVADKHLDFNPGVANSTFKSAQELERGLQNA